MYKIKEIKTYNFVNKKKKIYKFTKCVPWKSLWVGVVGW